MENFLTNEATEHTPSFSPEDIDFAPVADHLDDEDDLDWMENIEETAGENGQELNENIRDESSEETGKVGLDATSAAFSADQYILFGDLLFSRLFAWIAASDDYDKYAFTEREKREANKVISQYLESMGDFMTPQQRFFSFIGFFLVVRSIIAYMDREENIKSKKRAKEIQETPAYRQAATPQPDQNFGTRKKPDSGLEGVERRQFQTHKNGRYHKTPDGNIYLSKDESTYQAPKWIHETYHEKLNDGWSKGRINQHILDLLKNMEDKTTDIEINDDE